MNITPIYTRRLRDSARSLIGWAAGLAGVCALYLPLFPSMRDSGLLGDKLSAMPTGMLEGMGMDIVTMSTGWGYTHQTVFGMLGLLLLLVFGISTGARAIAGDEESGALELLLAHATDRSSVITARLLTLITTVVGLTVLLTGLVAALNGPSKLDLTPEGLVGEGAALTVLVLFHALVAFTAGALTGRRSVATASAAIVGVLGWFAHNMGAKVADWVPDASPFQWAYGDSPLHTGVDGPGLAYLALACLGLIALAYFGFTRRDLRA